MDKPLFSVGYRKGEMDFSVSAGIYDLDQKQYDELRSMLVAGIGTMEDMVRRAVERKQAPSQPLKES